MVVKPPVSVKKTKFKFAHLADCHLDSWREPELKKVNLDAFLSALDICKSENVDFVLIAGDIFHASTPELDILRTAVAKLKELKDAGIRIYIIPGSHDFSYSEKTMLRVLEAAGLFVNVSRGNVDEEGKIRLEFTVDDKTGAKITGLLGRAGSLEMEYYENLDFGAAEKEEGFKIFMFHSAIEEYKPEFLKNISSLPLSLLPKGFDYYAGGHVHERFEKDELGYGRIAFPGALYPVKFDELEKYKAGGFFIVEFDGQIRSKFVRMEPHRVVAFKLNLEGLTPQSAEQRIMDALKKEIMTDAIVLLRLNGTLASGKPTDIDMNSVAEYVKKEGALIFKRSTVKLSSKEFEEVSIEAKGDIRQIEADLIREHIGKIKIKTEDEKKLTTDLMSALDNLKEEQETIDHYNERVLEISKKVLKIADFGKGS
ncbi:MAG: exonuclease SbcCD subunit D [archaeon]